MKFLLVPIVFLAISKLCHGGPLRLQKRAAFYIANETACVVDNTVYSSGDPIPTDDPCEACKCRPPGFACVLKECQVKPGCRAVRRAGHCCPEYICGCEHNGRMYRDGDEIRDSKNPCYTCHCQGSSIACAFVDCLFRVDCSPEYVVGECCPRYPHCSSSSNSNTSYAAESTINPDIGTVVTTPPESETSLLDESKVEYATPEASLTEEKVAPETTVDSDSASPYIPEATKEEILERNNAGTTENEATTLSIPIIETIEVLHDVDETDESPVDLLNTESKIKKEYVEESGEEVSHEVLTTDASSATSEPTVAGSNVEIFADETTSNQEESYTTDGASTKEEVEIEANTIEKTFRALKNFTSENEELHSESADKEQPESPEVEVKSESPDIEEKSESADIEEKSESPEIKEKSESAEIEEKSETPKIEEKSETPEIEEKSETPETEEKSESPETEEKSESPEFKNSETPEIKEESESPENKELSDLEAAAETLASEAQDTSSTSVNEIKATEHSNPPASDTTTNPIEPTTKNPESLYYVDDKIHPTEISETVTVIVNVHEETTSSQVNEGTTTTITESKDASALPTSEKPSETTLSGNEKSETTN